ncbi:tRNA adenosine(34) deaminase TadA [Desulfoluna sp.]|uniref:tRNA adenosine(34) deaminase TadA n=1 Tax=Desulfoluna sp. TaxID=2045199 RepID=UPI002630F1AA|nr:tRNA adenosine(34) deaminase TadA [Desulfoluna sp.]
MENDTYYMGLALEEAKKAGQKGEVPIGCVIVAETGKVISVAHNLTISLADPTGHAEILAIRKAAKIYGNYRLPGLILYATIEPCIMCMGAIVHARLSRVVFGARDEKWGGAGSLYNLAVDSRLNHALDVVPGVCADECRRLIQDFFKSRRQEQKAVKKAGLSQ